MTQRPVRSRRQLAYVAFWRRPHVRTAPELRFLAGAHRVDAWMVARD